MGDSKEKFKKIAMIILIFYFFLVFSGCKVPSEVTSSPVACIQKAENSEIETKISEPPVQTELLSSESEPVGTESGDTPDYKNITTLVPSLPEGFSLEPILKSRPISGKPIIAIYKVREGDSPKEPKENVLKPDIAPAVKPEPIIAITPEPTIIPDSAQQPVIEQTPTVTAQNNVTSAVPAASKPVQQPVIEQPPTVTVQNNVTSAAPTAPEPASEPVLEPTPTVTAQNNVAPAAPTAPEPAPEPVIEQTPTVTVQNNVTTAAPAVSKPVPAPVIEQTPTVTAQNNVAPAASAVSEPAAQPVIEQIPTVTVQNNVTSAVPAASKPVQQPVIEQPPTVTVQSNVAPVAPTASEPASESVIEQIPTVTVQNNVTPSAPVVPEPAQQPIEANGVPPYIQITSPPSGTFYTKKIQLEGKIAVSAKNLNSVNGVGKVTWEIPGKKTPKEIIFGSDGLFFLNFSSEGYSGQIDILIKAENEDGSSSQKTISLYDGNVIPELTLISPASGSAYGALLQISGRVVDPSAKSLNLVGPASLEYSLFSVDNTSGSKKVGGRIPVASDGSFSTIIFSDNFSGEQLVTLIVHGRNGRTIEKSVSIVESDSAIPGFDIVQRESSVVISWEDLPGIEEYNLFYADKGIDPAGINGNKFVKVKSPVQIKNFREGYLYRFQLEAVPSKDSNKIIWSDIKETVILSENTLKPVATPGYQQISLVWLNIPGINTFDILRKEKSENLYTTLAADVTGTTYIDRNVEFGKKYSYKIKPAMEGSRLSKAVDVESLAFPEEKTVVLSNFGSSDLQGIEVAGSYIFLANGTGGIRIIDNSNSEKPLEVGSFQTTDAKDVLIRGERAYIADGFRGLKILDINDPGNPILLGSRKTTDASKLAILDNTVFIADGRSGIKIMDISSERKPFRIGSLSTNFAKDLVLKDSTLFLADGSGGLKVINVSNSSHLEVMSSFECKDAVALAVNNGIAYVADSGFGVRVLNVSDTSNPVEISQIPLNKITDIILNKNYIFVTDSLKGLLIYEISDPLRPVLFDTVEIKGASALAMDNGIIYVSDKEGFKTVESFTIGRSFVIAEYKTDGKAYNLTYIDHTLYLADHRNGVKIVDVSNPSDSSTFSTRTKVDTGYAESVVGYGSKLLIADGEGGVVIGNIINSEDGTRKINIEDSINLPGITKSLVVYNNKAYIAAREEGMHILDLDTKEVKTVYTGGSVQEIAVNKKLILVADGSRGLKVYSNTERPELLFSVKFSNSVTVALTADFAVVGGKDGFSLIDLSSPVNPVVISSYPAGWIEDIYLKSGYIYAAAGSEGLVVVDMKNPKDLVLVSRCKDVYAVGVEVENDLAFVADVDGFKVVRVLIPSWLR